MSKRKLLLADDSMTIQKVINLTFADEGIEVFTVGNGSLAIEKLSEIQPDLVLADVHMPGLNGYEVCEQIRQNPQFQDVPVMLLVGSFEPFDEREAERVGANDFLTKPFQSIRQLIQKVTALLDNSKSGTDQVIAAEAPAALAVETQVSQENLPPNAQEDFYIETPAALQSDFSSPSHNLSDMALDDEMIETSSVNNFDDNLSALTPSIQSGDQNNYGENEMTLEADEQSKGETATSNEIILTEETPLEMRSTEPLSFDDIQDINSSLPATLAPPEKQDEWQQTFEAEETNVANESIPAADFAQTLTANDWGPSVPSGKSDEEFEVELDLAPSQKQVFQNTDFELIKDEEAYSVESASQIEDFGFLPAPKMLAVENSADDEPLELDLADADLLQIYDEDSILDLDSEEAVDEMPTADFEVLPAMQEAVGRQNFNQPSSNALAQVGNQTTPNMNLGFPPEVIEAIAQLVVERLSDKVIEKIAWEIVPDRFDLIVRKQIEQRDR
jgi:CheY-like chemotaxis protein